MLDLSPRLSQLGAYPELIDIIVNHLLWADDLVLLALDENSLQHNLNILGKFFDEWGLSVNLTKTKIMFFGTRTCTYNFSINGSPVKFTDQYTYLGVVFHKNGTFSLALDELRKRATKGLFGLRRHIMRNSLSYQALTTLFDSLIKPILLYNCQIIAPHTTFASFISSISQIPNPVCVLDGPHINTLNQPINNKALLPHHTRYINHLKNDTYEKFHTKYLKWVLGVHKKICQHTRMG